MIYIYTYKSTYVITLKKFLIIKYLMFKKISKGHTFILRQASNYLGTAHARKFVSYNPALIDVKKLRTDNFVDRN